jgi:hypothetical protein
LRNLIEARHKLHLFYEVASMRSGGVISTCFAFLLFLSGCQTEDNLYLRQGAGIDLFSSNLPESTQLQDAYVSYICDQAGLGPTVPGPLGCDAGAFGSPQWAIFVQSGMNDIDQRCDAYLAWLDDRKRWTTPALQQISDLRTATEAIMVATGASGPYAIGIVGAAFGLATRTFTNLNSRLVVELNHSTVQAVVLNRQKQYRLKLFGDPAEHFAAIPITSRPAAIHALRSYLRLCMPFTIETEVNATITDLERTGVVAPPMIDPDTVRNSVIADVHKPLGTDPGPGKDSPDIFNGLVEKALCVSKTHQGREAAIKDFFLGRGLVQDDAKLPITTIKKKNVKQLLKNAIASFGDCAKQADFRNAFEVGRFAVVQKDNPKEQVAINITDFQTGLQGKLKLGDKDLTVGALDGKTRKQIIAFRKANTLNEELGDQIDWKLFTAVTDDSADTGTGAGSGTGAATGAGNGTGTSAGSGTGAGTAPGAVPSTRK